MSSSSSSVSDGILKFATQYSIYSGFITFSFGVIGNALNIFVFAQLKIFRNNGCTFYITVESIANFIYQLLSITLTILTCIYGDDATGRSSIWCKLRFILAQMCALTNFYMVCFSAVDQFFSTNHRFNLRQMCTLKLGRYFAFIFICFVIIHSIALGSSYNIQPTFGCIISDHTWIQYSIFFFYPVLFGFLPITIASTFSMLAYHNVRRIVRRQLPIVRRKLDKQITAMVLMRVIAFVCLVLPYATYRIYVTNFPASQSMPMAYAISRLLQAILLSIFVTNHIINFYIFIIFSSRFRRQVKFVLVKKCWERWKYWCCSINNRIEPDNNSEPRNSQMESEQNIIALGSSYNVQPTFGCVLSNYVAIQYSTYFLYPILGGFLPITIASSFSMLAYHNVRRIVRRQLPIVRRKLDKQITAMVLMRVIVFVCLTLPNTAYRVYAINFPTSRNVPMAYAISRLLQAIFISINLINYFISFYIFIIFSPRFRRQVKLVLVKKCWQRWKYWCCSINSRIEPENNIEGRNSQIESDENI
ncbi:unnamed protein product [Adineta steineri]|uniref:G-protein coupled receptors family 1 profile domain-containing protein n=1 Tax=Adineta steineri TaxID=433720 RepID=A0A819EFT6_9BILA|nr:unnamed protein product [Adineta steineri]